MTKNVFILSHDYWHSAESIQPIVPLLFTEEENVRFETDPEMFLAYEPDLFITFKDPVENDQIPTPIWCDEEWTELFLKRVENGMGVIALHAALTDLPADHPILKNIIRGTFLRHPHKCPLTFVPFKEHPVLDGIEQFEFPADEEHYFMELQENTEVIACAESEHGTQPAVWVHEYGKGRIVCITPPHRTESLVSEPFVRLLSNAVKWVSESTEN